MNIISIKSPYLIFVGGEADQYYAKTGLGLVEWRPELCKGQISLDDNAIDLGLPNMSLKSAVENGIKSLIIGTASVGGSLPPIWLDTLEEALLIGLDVVGGMHTPLKEIASLKAASLKSGAKIIDVREPPSNLSIGTGKKRKGKRILTVGTDCAVGKKYTALALEKDMRKKGMKVDFRASGQTGIMIAGRGMPIDAVVSDFLSGGAEILSPDNEPDHWDIIEGQGSILHPGYSAVSVGLLLGSQPDAIVVCHEAGRKHTLGWPEFILPTLKEIIIQTIKLGRRTNPKIKCIGVSVNTSKIKEEERERYLKNLSNEIGYPCVDPLKDGTEKIIDFLNLEFPSC